MLQMHVADVINEHIREELETCEFVGIQVNETLDVSYKSQMIIIFRFCTFEGMKKRFIRFFDVFANKNPKGLSEVINNISK